MKLLYSKLMFIGENKYVHCIGIVWFNTTNRKREIVYGFIKKQIGSSPSGLRVSLLLQKLSLRRDLKGVHGR